MCLKSAEFRHLPVLQWTRGKGFPWDKNVTYTAASLGDLSVLKWAVENGCPWDSSRCLQVADSVARRIPHGPQYDNSGHRHVRDWIRRGG